MSMASILEIFEDQIHITSSFPTNDFPYSEKRYFQCYFCIYKEKDELNLPFK